jgi:solute carrier family 25 phosphate transporter 23/24/25/41
MNSLTLIYFIRTLFNLFFKMNVNNFNESILKGIFAGLASSTSILSYPLEVLKIRSHVIENKSKSIFKNLIRKMYNEEGIISFYKGLNQNLIHGFVGYGIVFFIFDVVNKKLTEINNKRTTLNSIIASTLGGIAAVAITSPINFVKTRQILYKNENDKRKLQMINILKEIYKENKSVIGFWKALNPSLLTSLYAAIQISLYQNLKIKFTNNEKTENLQLNSLLGVISRCVACTSVFPFALIRSRILNFPVDYDNKKEIFFSSSKHYKNVIRDINLIIKQEGFINLFSGLKYELMKVSINGALFFYVFESLNTKFNK